MSDDEVLNITNKIDKLLENETTNNYKDSKILQENITDQLGQKGLVDYHVARRDLSLNKEVLNNAISKMNFESLSNEELKYLYPDVGYFTGSVNDKQIKQVLGLNNDVNLDVTPLRIKIRNILKERLPVEDDKITFDLTVSDDTATTTFQIDRTKFGIKYGSASFFDGLKDKAIYNEFDLKVSFLANYSLNHLQFLVYVVQNQ